MFWITILTILIAAKRWLVIQILCSRIEDKRNVYRSNIKDQREIHRILGIHLNEILWLNKLFLIKTNFEIAKWIAYIPIVILKDVSYSIMSELLQFMYQGEVNVKQAELQSFMSIAESLQIKGLATSTNNNNNVNNSSSGNNSSQSVRASDPANSSYSQFHANNAPRNHNQHHFNVASNQMENHRQATSTPLSTTSSVDNQSMKGDNPDISSIISIKIWTLYD